MAHFVRSSPAPAMATGGYTTFRPHVRSDFRRQCAYCLLEEFLAGGETNFELDHFRPKSQFPHLRDDFYNIYYSCHPCNWTKRALWPTNELEAIGVGFVDLCKEDFATHFRVVEDGHWEGLTQHGRYTVDALRLNRTHLVEIRRLLAVLGLYPHLEPVGEEQLRRRLNQRE